MTRADEANRPPACPACALIAMLAVALEMLEKVKTAIRAAEGQGVTLRGAHVPCKRCVRHCRCPGRGQGRPGRLKPGR